jgi:uncharacterized cupin superfamily protein
METPGQLMNTIWYKHEDERLYILSGDVTVKNWYACTIDLANYYVD